MLQKYHFENMMHFGYQTKVIRKRNGWTIQKYSWLTKAEVILKVVELLQTKYQIVQVRYIDDHISLETRQILQKKLGEQGISLELYPLEVGGDIESCIAALKETQVEI